MPFFILKPVYPFGIIGLWLRPDHNLKRKEESDYDDLFEFLSHGVKKNGLSSKRCLDPSINRLSDRFWYAISSAGKKTMSFKTVDANDVKTEARKAKIKITK